MVLPRHWWAAAQRPGAVQQSTWPRNSWKENRPPPIGHLFAGSPFVSDGHGGFIPGLATGWEQNIDDELLREDIGACVDGKPESRLSDPTQLAERLRSWTNGGDNWTRKPALGKKSRQRLSVVGA